MTPDQRDELERQVRSKVEADRVDDAATDALRGYGPEILGFLINAAADEDLAVEAFSQFSEDLWRGLSGFRWNASLRTWGYTLARHALHRTAKSKQRHRVVDPLSTNGIAGLVEEIRTRTLTFLRTESRQEVAALRATLSSDEQMLLTLRVDRQLRWRDIARITGDFEGAPSDDDLKRQVATLRKRFERTKNRLRAMAKANDPGRTS
ncbi:MAG: sigma-70 family RNA polymerase sigma factor [Myxococcota bacterium]